MNKELLILIVLIMAPFMYFLAGKFLQAKEREREQQNKLRAHDTSII